ncbi:MAG: metallophosphoesterase [Bacteroidota bacterium]
MSRFLRLVSLLLIINLLSSCANYKLNVAPELKDWESITPPSELEPEHSVYLIGDAGNSPKGDLSPALKLLKEHLKSASENSTVIFLGDNIYPDGLPRKNNPKRELAEHRLDAQLEAIEDFKGKPLFIPGNHDWRNYGLKGLKRQEKYIEKRLNEGIEEEDDWEEYFLPSHGCGGPELVEVNENLVIVVIDSQWWLSDWDKETEINDGCEAKSRKVFEFIFEEMVRKNRNKNVIIAMHHPLYSNGTHGGNFTAKEHIFPLTDVNENLYVPLPGLGSLAALIRGTVGTRQDLAHPNYREMKDVLMRAAKKNGQFIFVSGHEHALQYFENERQYYVVSGAGSKDAPTRLGNGAQFAYGQQGYARLDFYSDGSTWLEFWQAPTKDQEARRVFRKKIKDKLPKLAVEMQTSFPEYEEHKKSVNTHVLTTPVEKKGFLHHTLLGKHYRDLYTNKFDFPVLELDTFQGGVVPLKRGGGNQTNSLRLGTEDGKQYVMRAMTKDASRFIPYPFNKITASKSLVEDNFLSTHPFAATVIPPLASAAGIYHTNPKLYYIPKQPVLAEHNDLFGGGVYLVEERAAKDWSNLSSFGNSSKLIGTPDLAEKIVKNNKHRVDQPWVVRSRLFDMVIGDWDRHDDQWRWASFKKDGYTLYRPIPRDRDQPFSKYDGLFVGVARLTLPFLKQLKPYAPKVTNSKWGNYNARQFDKSFLNALSWEEWEKEVKRVQEGLTDEIVEEAFRTTWPEVAYTETAPEIMSFLKARRDNLMEIARKHYELLAKDVDVYGTHKRDSFDVVRLDDQRTQVRMYFMPGKKDRKKGVKPTLRYERIFYTNETKAISIFGLNGDDQFNIRGEVKKGIRIRVIGGLDEDEFVDNSKVSGLSKKTHIYDSPKGNKLTLGKEARDRTSNNRENNIYNRKDYHYEYDFLMPFPILGFNPDDGVLIGTSLAFTNYKFKKSPFGQTHQVLGTFAFSTRAYRLTYLGDFIEAIGKSDILIDAVFQAPRFTTNFFGLGNDTEDPVDDIDFNRVRNSLYRIHPALKRRFAGDNAFFTIGPLAERVKVERTENRFISQAENDLPDDIFESKYYAGGEANLFYESVDNLQMTHRGIRFTAMADWRLNLEDNDKQRTAVAAELTIYQSLTQKDNIIFATRLGTMHSFGDFEFFQASILGGNTNLRGFDAQRFAGRTSFYHQTELRIKLFNSDNGVIPFSFGLTGGFDYGRVWQDDEDSDTWHNAFGGGIWIAPVDFIVLSTELYKSSEQSRFRFQVGYAF